jgi:hypothetical protein
VFEQHRTSKDKIMRTLLAATAAIALLAAAGPVSAQMYQQPLNPVVPPDMTAQPYQAQPYQAHPYQPYQPQSYQPYQTMQAPMQSTQQPTYTSMTPSWMQDDGSSSDHPIHNPDDVSGDRLNAQYRDGLIVPPGRGFPAQPGQR